MSPLRLYASGFLLLLVVIAITAQDDTMGEPVEEPAAAETADAPAEEPEAEAAAAESSAPPLAEPTAAAAAEESPTVVSDLLTEPENDIVAESTHAEAATSDLPTAPATSLQTTKDVIPSTTAGAETVPPVDAVVTTTVVPPLAAAGGVQITSPDSGNVYVDDVINMRCVNPTGTEVEWVFSGPLGEIIIEDGHPYIISSSQINSETVSFLTIEGIQLEDAGEYSCRSVDNPSDKSTISITVAEQVKINEGTTAVPAVTESVTTRVDQPTAGSPETTTSNGTEDPGVPCRGDLCDDKDATTTETTDVIGEEASTVAAVPPAVTPVAGPCLDYKALTGMHFTVEKPDGEAPCFGLFDSPSAWIKFQLKDEEDAAEIPTVPIKQDYCGVHFAFHVHLQDKQMPATNETIAAEICSYLKGEVDQPCANNKVVKIHNCNDEFYVYKFPEALRDEKLCQNKGGADVCLKRPDEVIPVKYRSDIIPVTTVLPKTTKAIPDYDLPRLHDLTEEQENGTLTIEYSLPEDVDSTNCTGFWVDIDEGFRLMIANAVNAYLSKPSEPEFQVTTEERTTQGASTILTTTKPTPAPTEPPEFDDVHIEHVLEDEIEDTEPIFEEQPEGPQASDNIDDDAGKGPSKRAAKDRNDEDNKVKKEEPIIYTKDDIYYVYDTPICAKGIVQVAIVVAKIEQESQDSHPNRVKRAAPSGSVIPQGELDKAVSNIDKDAHKGNTGLEYIQHYQGEPREPDPKAGAMEGHVSIWDAHMGLFIAVIVLLIICLIVIIIGILCIKCKGEKSKPEKTPLRAEEGKSSTVIENPISDDEIIKGEAAMTEAPNPAYTPNGSGQHLTKGDEDNGWIVPLDELSYAERERPEVENTKL